MTERDSLSLLFVGWFLSSVSRIQIRRFQAKVKDRNHSSAVSRSTLLKPVWERENRLFYPIRDTFDAVGISVAFVFEIEAVSLAGVLQRGSPIDEKHSVTETRGVSFAHQKPAVSGDVVNVVFLAEFSNGCVSECVRSNRFERCME